MAVVYLAEDVPHGRDVAVKVLSPELTSSIDAERFRREIQIAARLSHPNILPAYDSGSANGLLYYVMPFIQGESLRARLDRESQLPDRGSDRHHLRGGRRAGVRALAGGGAPRHQAGEHPAAERPRGGRRLRHRAPGAGRGRREADADRDVDRHGVVHEPRAVHRARRWTGAATCTALACVLYEMLVGQVPFTGPNAMAIMARHTMQAVPSIRIVRSSGAGGRGGGDLPRAGEDAGGPVRDGGRVQGRAVERRPGDDVDVRQGHADVHGGVSRGAREARAGTAVAACSASRRACW